MRTHHRIREMALIDTFLKLMLEKRAERLVLVSGAVPFLLKGGETIELSMPSLPAEMIRRMGREVSDSETPEVDDHAHREGTFHAADGDSFGYLILPTDQGPRMEFHLLGAPRPEPQAEPLLPTSNLVDLPLPHSTPPRSSALRPNLLDLIDQALSVEASDIFLSSGKPVRVRRQGQITRFDHPPPDAGQLLELLPDEASRQEFEQRGSTDFSARWELSAGSRRFRINLFRHLGGIAAALRPIRQRIPSLPELHLPESLLDLVSYPGGLVLVTGASGSGKSTTLAALVDHLNRTRALHIITIEDPVEYEHREIQSLIHQREVGQDVESFGTGLRAALRENPDVILLGELRDLDTISAALTAAETGHLVLATLHSGTASAAVNRIVDVFPGHQQASIRTQLSVSLRAVLSQRLVLSRARQLLPVLEKLVVTPAVANGIREGHDHHIRNAMLTGADEGMTTLERSLAQLVRKGAIDRETAFLHAADSKALIHQLG